jgi:putrescine aminotransferase
MWKGSIVSRGVVRSEGLYVWLEGDDDPFVDLVQGFATTNWGHRHPKLIDAAKKALEEVDLVTGFRDACYGRVCGRLERGVGVESADTYFDVGGAQIVRLAIHAAVVATGRSRAACLRACFHGYGCTGELLTDSYLGSSIPRRECHLSEVLEIGSASALARIQSGDLAAVIVEAIQGAAGFQKLPIDWLEEVARACRNAGTLLIADEIQVGLGRAGTFTALEQTGVLADIYLFGKALGGGIFPVSAMVARSGIFPSELSETYGFGSTFSDSQFGMRIASAVLDLLDETLDSGDVFGKGSGFCEAVAGSAPGAMRTRIRAHGLAVAMDFDTPEAAARFRGRARERHILVQVSGVRKDIVKMFPPLNLDPGRMRVVGERLGEILSELEEI